MASCASSQKGIQIHDHLVLAERLAEHMLKFSPIASLSQHVHVIGYKKLPFRSEM